jgi:hypothetical protein
MTLTEKHLKWKSTQIHNNYNLNSILVEINLSIATEFDVSINTKFK